jgi:hypothetical protein
MTEITARVHERGDGDYRRCMARGREAWLGLCGDPAGYQKIMKSKGEEPDPATVRRRAVAELIAEILDSAFFPSGPP